MLCLVSAHIPAGDSSSLPCKAGTAFNDFIKLWLLHPIKVNYFAKPGHTIEILKSKNVVIGICLFFQTDKEIKVDIFKIWTT